MEYKKRRSNMSIGLRRGQVALEDHQKEWDQYGERLIDKLREILEDKPFLLNRSEAPPSKTKS